MPAVDEAHDAEPIIRTGTLLVDLNTRTVTANDQPVQLTGKEFAVLELLALHKGAIVTKEMLLNHLYGGYDEPEMAVINSFVGRLRKKLAQATGGQHYIETTWGRGYALRDPARSRGRPGTLTTMDDPPQGRADHRRRERRDNYRGRIAAPSPL